MITISISHDYESYIVEQVFNLLHSKGFDVELAQEPANTHPCQQAKALQEELYEAWRNANNGRDAA